jgi:hypothetical protein
VSAAQVRKLGAPQQRAPEEQMRSLLSSLMSYEARHTPRNGDRHGERCLSQLHALPKRYLPLVSIPPTHGRAIARFLA